MNRGLFLTIEGLEGAGKSSLAADIAKWTTKKKISTVFSKEPGTSWNGAVREILLQKTSDPMAELLLFLADRREHIAKVINPALENNSWVVLDRFIDSTFVYQGAIKNVLPFSKLYDINQMATGGLLPDLTFLLDVDPEVALKRLSRRSDKQERMVTDKDLELAYLVRGAFLDVAKRFSRRFILVDANQSAKAVRNQVFEFLEPLGDHWLKCIEE